jgi:hypothetical protein
MPIPRWHSWSSQKNSSRLESLIYNIVTHTPVAMQRAAKHIPAEANSQNNRTSVARQRPQYAGKIRITPVDMQSAVNTAVFSMRFSYIHCGATNMFSLGPPRDCISSPVVNQKSVVQWEREWSKSSADKEEGFGWRLIVSYCNELWLREIVKKALINPTIQSKPRYY